MDKMDKVLNEVQNVDNNISTMLIPILQDTIADGNRHNKRLFIITILAILTSVIIGITSMILIYKQNQKYQEFLSQFDFTTEAIYQDVDSGDSGISTINDGIKINQ